jgi:hypothetical protein
VLRVLAGSAGAAHRVACHLAEKLAE